MSEKISPYSAMLLPTQKDNRVSSILLYSSHY